MSRQIDYAHSDINFTVRHMMISKVNGRFENWHGIINFDIELELVQQAEAVPA